MHEKLKAGTQVLVKNQNYLLISNINETGFFDAVLTDTDGIVSYQQRHSIAEKSIEQIVGQIPTVELKKILNRLLKRDLKNYYDQIHKPEVEKPFEFGKTRLGFAGRVYDHQEMENLLDANLKFFLTADRFDLQFCQNLARFLRSGSVPNVRVLTANSGSSANLLAITALTSHKLGTERLQIGDEVITVAAGFPTTIAPIFQNGLLPVFVDIELGTYNIDPEQMKKAITKKTKAIFVAHTLGNPFDLDQILSVAEQHDLWVIEDGCDALGAQFTLSREYRLKGGKIVSGTGFVGTFGHIGTTSFYPAHHITMGEGGAVFSSNPDLQTILLSFRDWGRDCYCDPGKDNTCKKRFEWQLGKLPFGYDHKYTYSHLGYNLKITDMQAAIGCAQLEKLPMFIEKRRQNWAALYRGLEDLDKYFILPRSPERAKPSPFGFVLTIRESAGFKRNDITNFLEQKKIQTRVVFAGNLLMQPALTETTQQYRVVGDLDNTNIVMSNTFWVGVYPGIRSDMLDYMIEQIRTFIKNQAS